jgi:hypothetical protein
VTACTPPPDAAAVRSVCRHCHAEPVSRPRGLGWKCYYAPGVRDLYPARANHLERHDFPPCRLCGRGVATSVADYHQNFHGTCSTCKRPEPERSRRHARIDAHARRVAAVIGRLREGAA